MGTRVYGASDDLIEFEGDFSGETGGGDDPRILIFNDGTILSVKYGKPCGGVWAIEVINAGALFDHIDICTDSEAERYSDTVHFKAGITRVIAASKFEFVS